MFKDKELREEVKVLKKLLGFKEAFSLYDLLYRDPIQDLEEITNIKNDIAQLFDILGYEYQEKSETPAKWVKKGKKQEITFTYTTTDANSSGGSGNSAGINFAPKELKSNKRKK